MTNDDTRSAVAGLFDAEREVRRLHAALVARGPEVAKTLAKAVEEARALDDEEERALRLVRVAHVLAELEGEAVVDLLVDVLASDEPEARTAAGEALEELAFDRFKEVALGVERALARLPRGSLALQELPFVLVDVPEPGVLKLLGKFLKHEDPEAVASAVEALVEMGDPAAAPLLVPLERDRREVRLEDEEGEEGTVTLGELAVDAREALGAAAGARGS